MRLYGAVLTVLSVKSVAAGCGWIVRGCMCPASGNNQILCFNFSNSVLEKCKIPEFLTNKVNPSLLVIL